MRPCKCGCGVPRPKNREYVVSHSKQATRGGAWLRMSNIRPAGMTYERALEIAVEVHRGR
jgi:hypothetical protein